MSSHWMNCRGTNHKTDRTGLGSPVRSLYLWMKLSAVLKGGHAILLLKLPHEMVLIVVAAALSDFLHPQIGVRKELHGAVHAGGDEIVLDAGGELLLVESLQMCPADAKLPRDGGDAPLPLRLGLNVPAQAIELLTVGSSTGDLNVPLLQKLCAEPLHGLFQLGGLFSGDGGCLRDERRERRSPDAAPHLLLQPREGSFRIPGQNDSKDLFAKPCAEGMMLLF